MTENGWRAIRLDLLVTMIGDSRASESERLSELNRVHARRRNLAVAGVRGVAVLAICLLGSVAAVAMEAGTAFRTDILPVLTKAGCNSGACHGAATGQGGFRLSLLGYDAEEDYRRITREGGGRRVDLELPERSLLLRKPSEDLDHEGGRRLRRGSVEYARVRAWLVAGAPYGPRDLRVERIEVEPAETMLAQPGASVDLRVSARLSDGTTRDATAQALFTSNDDSVVEVTRGGAMTARGAGLSSVMVRYGGQVAAVRVAVPFPVRRGTSVEFVPLNYIDTHVQAEWRRLGVEPARGSRDAEFLRRVHLDLAGRLPAEEEVRRFLQAPPSVAKRQQTIDRLLAGDDFVDLWTMHLADLLLVRGEGEGPRTYHAWLRRQVAQGAGYDALVRALLTGTGKPSESGPASYMTLASDPRDLAEHVGRMFLGTQIGCARCHAHPSDRWTQDDYHAFAAYFARVRREDGAVVVAAAGEVDHPKTGRPVLPRPLGGGVGASLLAAGTGVDRREALAAWLVGGEDAGIARAMANRVWRLLMGRGLVEPVDDLRPTNPATHPALLDALARDFAEHGYDLRHLVRRIVGSATYQLASTPVDGEVAAIDRQLYSHAAARELPAVVYADMVAQATGMPDVYRGERVGTRAVALVGPTVPSEALDVLGRCQRQRACDPSGGTGGGLARALHLINGSTVNAKLSSAAVRELARRPSREAVEVLYLRTLSRPPHDGEWNAWEALLDRAADRTEVVQDLLWALLNTREFALNH